FLIFSLPNPFSHTGDIIHSPAPDPTAYTNSRVPLPTIFPPPVSVTSIFSCCHVDVTLEKAIFPSHVTGNSMYIKNSFSFILIFVITGQFIPSNKLFFFLLLSKMRLIYFYYL